MDEKFLLTTTNTFEGYSILEYKDVISEEVIFATKLISQFKNKLNDFLDSFGAFFEDTELSGTSTAILKAKEYVKEKLKAKAKSIGANAIVGIDYETSLGTSDTNIRVSINGTAVVIKKTQDIQRENEERKKTEEENKERTLKIQRDKEKFKNSDTFMFSHHEENLNNLKSAKEIYEYIVELNIQDEYFTDVVIPELNKMVEIERFYGNKHDSIINRLKELTSKDKNTN